MSSTSSGARIGAVAVAVPPCRMTQRETEAFFMARFGGSLSRRSMKVMQQVMKHPSIRSRHFALDSPECVVEEDPDERIARFNHWSVRLAAEAGEEALKRAGVSPAEVSAVVVNTCTGYLCPGLSTYLIEVMRLAPTVRAYDLVGAGCGGALPNLELSRDIQRSMPGGVVLSVSVEICSATFQMGDDLSLIISNAIFGDGASACVVWDRPEGLLLSDSARLYCPEHREAIRYVHKGGQLHNQLSLDLPKILGRKVAEIVPKLAASQGLELSDVAHWAIHPGGEKVLNEIRDALALPEEQMSGAREVLAEYGNMSSPTVTFQLERVMGNGVHPGDWCMMVAAGAGLSVHAFLLRR